MRDAWAASVQRGWFGRGSRQGGGLQDRHQCRVAGSARLSLQGAHRQHPHPRFSRPSTTRGAYRILGELPSAANFLRCKVLMRKTRSGTTDREGSLGRSVSEAPPLPALKEFRSLPTGREPGEAWTPGSMREPGSQAWQDQMGFYPSSLVWCSRSLMFRVSTRSRHKNTGQEMPPPRTSSISIGSAPAK